MNDLFGGNDRMAELEARVQALESLLMPQVQRERVKADEPLNEAWQLWNRHRNGKGWTAKARELSMRTLRDLAKEDGQVAMQIVCQSIERGWTGLFPVKICGQDGRASIGATNTVSSYKTPEQALAPTETKEERDAAHKAHLRRLGIRED